MELIYKNYVKMYPEVTKDINIQKKGSDLFAAKMFCAYTGKEINEGVALDDAFKENFTDIDEFRYIRTGYVDAKIAVLMANYDKYSGLRNHCILAFENEMRLISYSTFADEIFNIQQTPFEAVFSFTLKKHIAYKSKPQYNVDNFIIYTDRGEAIFDRAEINIWYPIIKEWYSEYKKGKSYFTQLQIAGKQDISTSQILNYGKDKFFKENEILEKYRNTLIFELLTFKTLKKDEYND